MIEKEKTDCIRTSADSERRSRPHNRPTQKQTDRIYQIACSFPALIRKGVEQGDIPGIRPNGFYDIELSDYLYQGGGVLSSGEFLLLEFLLNLYNPDAYSKFNMGRAVRVLDSEHMRQCLCAVVRVYSGK